MYTIFRMFKNYKPMTFFASVATLLLLIGVVISIPVIIEFLNTGLVPKLPTAVLSMGFVTVSVITYSIGIILDTCVRQHKEVLEILSTINKNKN